MTKIGVEVEIQYQKAPMPEDIDLIIENQFALS